MNIICKIMATNANTLYMEELRLNKKYNEIALLGKLNCQQLIDTRTRLIEVAAEMKPDLM